MSSQSGSQLVEYDSECYEVECIRDRKIVKGKKFYFVKWKGWDEKDNTWQPIENLCTVLGMVTAFDKQYEQGSTAKKDHSRSLPTKQIATNQAIKKTKHIEKQKKKKRSQQASEVQQSSSQNSSAGQQKQKRVKKEDKKEVKKSIVIPSSKIEMSGEKEKKISKEKEKEKEVEKNNMNKQAKQRQRQRQKQKQKSKQVVSNKKNEAIAYSINNNKISAEPSLNKQSSKTTSQMYNNNNDIVEISRINYHIMVPPSMPHLSAKLYYNVDRKNKVTKKYLSTVDMPSDQLQSKNPQMVIEYLENFVKEVEFYSYQKREYENKNNQQNQSFNFSK